MGNFWLGFVAALFLVWFTYKVYELLKQKLGGNRWYRVVDVQPFSMPGYWSVEFMLADHHVFGYCKKQPPQEVNPRELMVRIKHFNSKNGLYHLHWEVIPKAEKERKDLGF